MNELVGFFGFWVWFPILLMLLAMVCISSSGRTRLIAASLAGVGLVILVGLFNATQQTRQFWQWMFQLFLIVGTAVAVPLIILGWREQSQSPTSTGARHRGR